MDVSASRMPFFFRLLMVFLFVIPAAVFATHKKACAEEAGTTIADPCLNLLAVLDRPTVSDSACAAPLGRAVLELGFQHADLRGGGRADNYPEAEMRYGLPGRNEIKVLAPNYTSQRTPDGAAAGLSAASVGFKHELGYNSKCLGSVEAIVTPPSGNAVFGSRGLGAAFLGIVNYAISDQVSTGLEIGVNSQTEPKLSGGGRFTSLVSNFVAAWQPLERLQFYGEVFGQTKTAPDEGAGYNFDGGIQYLIAKNWEADAEEGLRLAGNLGGFTHYYGAGMGFFFNHE